MDYLGLCQRLRREAGAAGDGPSSVTAQVGEYRRFVGWVAQAWREIQQLHQDWKWAWGTFSYECTPGVADTGFDIDGVLLPGTLRLGGTPLQQVEYFAVRDRVSTSGAPRAFAVLPSGAFRLLPVPDEAYTITGEFYRHPQILVENGDVPLLPERHHMTIVYRALMHYAAYEAADEVARDAFVEYMRALSALERDQLPGMQLGGGLA